MAVWVSIGAEVHRVPLAANDGAFYKFVTMKLIGAGAGPALASIPTRNYDYRNSLSWIDYTKALTSKKARCSVYPQSTSGAMSATLERAYSGQITMIPQSVTPLNCNALTKGV